MSVKKLTLLALSLLLSVETSVTATHHRGIVQDQATFNHGVDSTSTRIEDLSQLSENLFSELKHPSFPRHSVRIKKTRFCDETVKAYTGYIDIEARHLFFYFFESRSNPEADDIIYWTNGGPGCSPAAGLFMELGPCRILDAAGPKFHPESWNSKANLLAVEQPVGVGFSYADYGEHVDSSEEAAKDLAAFLAIFFEHFKQFRGRGLHMAGESYAGIYIPLFAAEVYDQNTKLIKEGMSPINLTSIMIGNGLSDAATMFPSYYDMQCTFVSGMKPIQDISTCVRMKQAVPRCKKWIRESCVEQLDRMNCQAALGFCATALESPIEKTGLNPYDLTRKCGESDQIPCYPLTSHISRYLSIPSVREQLGVDPSTPTNFSLVDWDMNTRLGNNMDHVRSTTPYIAALLERRVRVLIYVGEQDFSCNWIGNEQWTLDMEWSGGNEFRKQDLETWNVDGKKAGKVRSAMGLSFVTVEGAGHMVPYDKPKQSLELCNRWIYERNI
ncbi:serine carboxypeptidase [Crucibulum laeve]|uniref:Carboxypeptidase n=1 Tax=Crucibulum laeve TaxID=68775 RepID=A0A5C3M307_9AGAR|nr:serine carboxypeptidase [Crucibulum laeve]